MGRSSTSWALPTTGLLKHNVDDTLFKDLRAGSMGACLWDHLGQVLVAFSKLVLNVSCPTTMEALSILRAVSVVRASGLSGFMLESNTKVVVDEVNSIEFSLAPFGNLL